MIVRSLATQEPPRSLRIAVAVDAELRTGIRSALERPYHRDYCLPVIAALRNYFQVVQLIAIGEGANSISALSEIAEMQPDIVYNLAHSASEHEASFIGALELLQIPFTGSGQFGMLLSRDKSRAKAQLRSFGINVPQDINLHAKAIGKNNHLPFPAIVKPSRFGASSRGIFSDSVVTTGAALRHRVARLQASGWRDQLLCEEFIVGREFRIAAIKGEKDRIQFIGISESIFERAKPGWGFKTARIRSSKNPGEDFGVYSRLVPRSQLSKTLEIVTMKCAQALDLRGPVTVDARLNDSNEVIVLEANANPGLSAQSKVWGGKQFLKNLKAIVAEGLSR